MKLPQLRAILALGAMVILAGCASPNQPSLSASAGSYISIVSNDLDSARDWYAFTFEAEVLAERENETVRITMLRGKSAVIEIIEFKSDVPVIENRHVGLFKVGAVVESLEQEIARLKLGRIISSNEPMIVEDPEAGIRSFVIRDPENNRVQLFEHLETQK